jgi:glycosyltransferase involved in cell wall biosynthesis
MRRRWPGSRRLRCCPVRVCIVYDCIYPFTVGGAERWYRQLAERLAEHGHEVTYLTLRQWDEPPVIAGVRLLAVGPRMSLYVSGGRRRILPPVVFGAGVFAHLLRHGRDYDVVHTSAFPYFSLLAAAALRRRGRYELVVEWVEVWSADYWQEYLGRVGGRIGWAVQRACARIRSQAFCVSRLHADRLIAEGHRGGVEVLPGHYVGPLEPETAVAAEDLVVFAARMIPEKRALSVVPAIALATERIPGLRAVMFGDGPERPALMEAIAQARGVEVSAPGFTEREELLQTLRRSLCMLLPSRREGFGIIVVEAAVYGVPSIVVRDADNAAVELIEHGVNGLVVDSADPSDLAGAIVAIHAAGPAMRASTRDWFARNAKGISAEASLERVLALYARLDSAA